MSTSNIQNIEALALITVTGGAPQAQQPQPIKPAIPNYGAPKYSAAWWDFVRAGGGPR
jgi:hypothetical protein